ncbi:MAG: hypothetical protein ACTSU7_09900 [Candidatus Heimdallarchaeaceae archaeon]
MKQKAIDLNIIIDSIDSMKTKPFDYVTTSVAVTMRTKNDLKELKGSKSYEEFLREMMRNHRNQVAHGKVSGNVIETVKFERAISITRKDDLSLTFSYNKFIPSELFRFDIAIDSIRKKGKKISFETYAKNNDAYEDYFAMLAHAIRQEIEPMFTFRKYGREDYKDYMAWKKRFQTLGLSKTSFEEDVMDKLNHELKGKTPYD